MAVGSSPAMDKTVLLEYTSKRLKRWEFIVTTILFLMLWAVWGLLYVAISLAVAAWLLSGVCLLAFIAVRVVVW